MLSLFKPQFLATSRYRHLPKYPKVSQDITLSVSSDVSFQALTASLTTAIERHQPEYTYTHLEPLDIYKKDTNTNYSYRLTISHYNRTMTAKEVNDLLDVSALAVADNFSSVRI